MTISCMRKIILRVRNVFFMIMRNNSDSKISRKAPTAIIRYNPGWFQRLRRETPGANGALDNI